MKKKTDRWKKKEAKVMSLLGEVFSKDTTQIDLWLDKPNENFNNRTPRSLLEENEGFTNALLFYLENSMLVKK